MKSTESFLTAILVAGLSSLAMAQHGGHGGGGEFGHAGHDPSMEDMQRKMNIQANNEQRTQLRTCLELSERLRMMTAEMKKATDLSESERAKVREQWSALLRQEMQSDHQAFVGSLNADQQAALQGRLQKMDRTWSELTSRFQVMDRDLAEAAPEPKRFSDHVKELEKSLKKWQKQHRELESEMGVEG